MVRSLIIVLIIFTGFPTMLNATGNRMVSAVMNVSVEAIEPSSFRVDQNLVKDFSRESGSKIKITSDDGALISLPSHPDSQMSISVRGLEKLNDGNGREIFFNPKVELGNDIVENKQIEFNGESNVVQFTENGRGGYRSVLILELYGEIDLNGYDEGNFSTTYTITAEHF